VEDFLRFDGATRHDEAVDIWLDDRPEDLGAIARRWFLRMRACGDDVRELVHDGCPVVCVEDAPFAYVHVFTAHVNVGFYHGNALDDPSGILLGNGKHMRHVTAKPGDEPDPAAIEALIDAAYQDIKHRLAGG
jgi:hypothetical protein